MPTRILIADDHGVLRAGLNILLSAEPDLEVVGEATTAEEALRLAAGLKPDIIIMDISMPEMGGIEATRRVRKMHPQIQVFILTMHDDLGLLREAIQAGAGGYILKKAVKTELIHAIHTLLRGDLYVHPQMARGLLEDHVKVQEKVEEAPETLTQREIEVLSLIAKGYTNTQIAEILHISVRTVEFHRSNISGKLNLHSRVELVRFAAEQGLI